MNIKIFGEINDSTTEMILKKVKELNRENVQKIVIYIDSEGGIIDNAYKIREALLPYKDIITTVARNSCSSCAIVIFLLGSKRYSMPNCKFLFHRPFYKQESFAKEDEHITVPFLNERLKALKEAEKKFRLIFKESNFPDYFIKYIFSNDKDIHIKVDDLIDWKVIDGFC